MRHRRNSLRTLSVIVFLLRNGKLYKTKTLAISIIVLLASPGRKSDEFWSTEGLERKRKQKKKGEDSEMKTHRNGDKEEKSIIGSKVLAGGILC